jgi:hypothetical protein
MPVPDETRDRWGNRAEPDSGKGAIYWHILFRDNPGVRATARKAQARLASFRDLHMTAGDWLHATALVAGTTDDISSEDLDLMLTEARQRLSRVQPTSVTVSRVLYHPRGDHAGVHARGRPRSRPPRCTTSHARSHRTNGQRYRACRVRPSSGSAAGEGFELTEVAFVWQPVGQVPDDEEQTAGGQERGLVLLVAGGQRAHRLVPVEQDLVQLLGDVDGRDRQVEGVVAPRGAIEVDRPGLARDGPRRCPGTGQRGPARTLPGPGPGGRARRRLARLSRPGAAALPGRRAAGPAGPRAKFRPRSGTRCPGPAG